MPSEDFSARMERVIQKREAGTITLHGAEQYEFHRPNHGRAVPVERAGRATLHLYPLTMLLLFVPLHLLYEVSVFIARIWERRAAREEAAAAAA